MPTEEVFTLPHKDQINGKVVSSKPLNFRGNLINNFSFEFIDGKVVKVIAEQGQEVLEKLIAVDEGASFIGEVALVSYNTPISLSNVLFYNTLFDENASCHLALGQAYPTCLTGSSEMSEQQLASHGLNKSAIHVDFMFGTSDLSVTGIKADGSEHIVFKAGNFIT